MGSEMCIRDSTYTIAFGSDVSGDPQGLLDTANAGRRDGAAEGSQSFTANTSDDLTTVFEQIIRDIGTVESDSFVAPAVAVNAFNRLQFRDDLYFALFQPDNRPRWPGNIKKFRIDGATGNVIDFNNPCLLYTSPSPRDLSTSRMPSSA